MKKTGKIIYNCYKYVVRVNNVTLGKINIYVLKSFVNKCISITVKKVMTVYLTYIFLHKWRIVKIWINYKHRNGRAQTYFKLSNKYVTNIEKNVVYINNRKIMQ